jgi:hypothetical protein
MATLNVLQQYTSSVWRLRWFLRCGRDEGGWMLEDGWWGGRGTGNTGDRRGWSPCPPSTVLSTWLPGCQTILPPWELASQPACLPACLTRNGVRNSQEISTTHSLIQYSVLPYAVSVTLHMCAYTRAHRMQHTNSKWTGHILVGGPENELNIIYTLNVRHRTAQYSPFLPAERWGFDSATVADIFLWVQTGSEVRPDSCPKDNVGGGGGCPRRQSGRNVKLTSR